MSDGRAVPRRVAVRVVVVGESSRVDAATAALEDRFEEGAVVTVPDAETARERLARGDVECVVCDVSSDAPGGDDDADPTAPVATIRDANPVLPIVALVADGDATGASAAIGTGVTDVVRSGDAPAVVAARVANAIERYRLESRADSDGRYRAILEGADAAVVVLDEAGNAEYVSPAIERATGYTPDEVERMGVATLVHPDHRDRLEEILAELRSASHGTTVREPLVLRHADGTRRVYAATFANRLADPVVEGIVATLEGPGPGVRSETGLEDPLERFPDAVLALGPDWEVEYANERAVAFLELEGSRETIHGTVVWDLLPGSVRERLFERSHEARRTGESVAFELPRANGSSPLEVRVHPATGSAGEPSDADDASGPAAPDADDATVSDVGVTIHAREIDATVRTDGLRRRLERFESVLDALPDGVIVFEESRVVDANRRAAAMTGRDALVGRSVADVLPESAAAAVRERASSPIDRRAEPVEATLEGDGETPVEIRVASTGAFEGTVCLLRDASRSRAAERAVSLLTDAGRTLRSIQTRYDVYRSAAHTAADGLRADFVGAFRATGDGLDPVAVAGSASASADSVGSIRRGEPSLEAALEAGSATAFDASATERLFGPAGIGGDRALAVPVADEALLLATATSPGRFDHVERAFLEALAAAAAVGLELVERDATSRARERDLVDARNRADRLESVLEALTGIGRRIVRADDRAAVERSAVEELVELADVAFAWVGDANVSAGSVDSRVGWGEYRPYLEATTVSIDEDGEPTGRTAATRTPTTVEDVGETPPGPAWRREALDLGIRSIYSVPILHDGYLYGVLSVYADRPAAFDDAARSALSALGEAMAHAIVALETRRTLLSDRVTELELAVRDDDDPFARLAREAGGRIVVDSVVPRSDGLSTVFVAVPGEAAPAVSRAAGSLESVASIRPVTEADETARYEVTADSSTVVATIAAHGAVVRSIDRRDDRTVVALELARDADVRSFVEMIERTHPGVELVSRGERDRSRPSNAAFRDALRDRLSDQQRRSLEAAYRGGYFEWPRERTGEEVAESLGVSQPTFNRHFRTAQRKLFTLLFEE